MTFTIYSTFSKQHVGFFKLIKLVGLDDALIALLFGSALSNFCYVVRGRE